VNLVERLKERGPSLHMLAAQKAHMSSECFRSMK
jgi:hypothetical protein